MTSYQISWFSGVGTASFHYRSQACLYSGIILSLILDTRWVLLVGSSASRFAYWVLTGSEGTCELYREYIGIIFLYSLLRTKRVLMGTPNRELQECSRNIMKDKDPARCFPTKFLLHSWGSLFGVPSKGPLKNREVLHFPWLGAGNSRPGAGVVGCLHEL